MHQTQKPLTNPFARDIEYFLYIAEETSLSAAAEKLGVRQSTLSVSLKTLEERIGTPLFERGRSGIKLTKEGSRLALAWKETKSEFLAKTQQALQTQAEDLVRIGVVPHFSTRVVIPFLKKHSKWSQTVQIYTLPSLQIYEAVISKKLDFGYITWTEKPKGVESLWLRSDPVAVVGLKNRFSHIERATSHDDLVNEPWVTFPKPQRDWSRILSPKVPGHVVRDSDGLRQIILQGLAIGEIQTGIFTAAEIKLLSFAPVPLKHSQVDLYLITRAGLSKKLQATRDQFTNAIKL